MLLLFLEFTIQGFLKSLSMYWLTFINLTQSFFVLSFIITGLCNFWVSTPFTFTPFPNNTFLSTNFEPFLRIIFDVRQFRSKWSFISSISQNLFRNSSLDKIFTASIDSIMSKNTFISFVLIDIAWITCLTEFFNLPTIFSKRSTTTIRKCWLS